MFTTVLEILLLRRPASTPLAFWRWFKPVRIILILIWIGGVGGTIVLIAAQWSEGGMSWTSLFQFSSRLSAKSSPALIPFVSLGLVLVFAFIRRPIYSWAKRKFFTRLRHADFEVCQCCAYSLKGLPNFHRCPECGSVFQRETTRQAWQRWMNMRDEDWPEDSGIFGPYDGA